MSKDIIPSIELYNVAQGKNFPGVSASQKKAMAMLDEMVTSHPAIKVMKIAVNFTLLGDKPELTYFHILLKNTESGGGVQSLVINRRRHELSNVMSLISDDIQIKLPNKDFHKSLKTLARRLRISKAAA
jgi:hypothetical protein